MNIKKTNFLEYIGSEEQNFLTSIVNFKEEFDLFSTLDRIYDNPRERLEIKPDTTVIGQLFLFVHFHLYFSVSCIMRAHLSEALSSLRTAIDGALSAYEMILDPNTTKAYLDKNEPGHNRFVSIKATIKNAIETDKTRYLLAHELVKLHEGCSEYGSHADISSFAHRLEIKEIAGQNKKEVSLHFFQFPKNDQEYRLYFIVILLSFWYMFKIFKIFFDKNLKIIDPAWEQAIEKLGIRLNELREKYFKQTKSL